MASTAVRFPADKDPSQLSFWPDNDELAITGDTFFDQFLTFDTGDAPVLGGEVLEDPPSPSILLESLQNESVGSSDPFDLPPNGSLGETSTTGADQSIVDVLRTTENQTSPDSALFSALRGDPIPNSGSISDSELLHLEGISIRSSPHRGNVTEPSSPFASSAPLNPQQRSRFVESVYGTSRRTARRPKPVTEELYQPPIDMSDLDAFLADPRSGLEMFDVNFDELPAPEVALKQNSMDCLDLPLSPPLTGRIPQESQASPSGFVTGHLDDPFSDDVLGTPATAHSAKRADNPTPMDTPLINGEAYFHNQVAPPVSTTAGSFRHPPKTYRSANSAEWPLEGLLTDVKFTEDANIWSATSPTTAYVTDTGNRNVASPSWWETPELAHAEPPPPHGSVHDNAAHNLSMHAQQAGLPYEYNADLLSGLMIHMPQPRTPQAGVLGASLNEHLLATPTAASAGSYHTPRQTRHFAPPHGSKHGERERRPRPRAPSSGARHHGAQASPRKLHHSRSLGYLREEAEAQSPSSRHHGPPLPSHHLHAHPHVHQSSHHHGGQDRRQSRSTSTTMRKQRSFTRRSSGAEARTAYANGGGRAGGGGGGGEGGGGGGLSLDFVNFTPNDKHELMTGVAPSGSSKTKARREKEALEKTRMISETALRLAHGDVNAGVLKELMKNLAPS